MGIEVTTVLWDALCYDVIALPKLDSAETKVLSERIIGNARIMLTN
jgi:hypothetical protein